jgi:AmmeMemoRadiSam system protein A
MNRDSGFGISAFALRASADKRDSMLKVDDELLVLAVARQALEARVAGLGAPDVQCVGPFALRCGAFVSIHQGDDLRGCLGRLTCDWPLGRTIVHLGAAVADRDPRFPPVMPSELPLLQIEISLLTPERPVASVDEVEVGRHGLIVEHGYARGLLLPQVATEHAWDRETFLEHTCIKAGLPRDAWRNGARIHVFEAHVFSEA